MTRLSDELLQQIAKSNNKPYAHEGRAMAQEILERRKAEAETLKAAAGLMPTPGGGWKQPLAPPAPGGVGSAPQPPPAPDPYAFIDWMPPG